VSLPATRSWRSTSPGPTEPASERLYAVWESKRTPTVSRLLLASFGPDGWSEPIEISGDVAPLKDEPRILIGRDRFAVHEAPDELQSRNRTVIHVLWREEGSAGSGLFYTPVILEAGKYVGWNPVVALADLEPELTGEPEPEAADLLRNPVLAPGQDIYSAIIAFASPASGRMITVEARLLPGELGFLADDIRGDIIEIGSHDRGAIATLAKSFAAEIVETAHQLNSDVVQHFADLARAAVVADYDAKPDQPPGALADHVRADIIEIGDRLLGGPGPHGLPCELLEVGPGTGGGQAASPSEPGVTHLVRLRIVADRPAPPLDGIPGTIFVSEDGERLLVGWLSKGKVYYTESGEDTAAAGEVWTAVKHLTLTERLGLSEAAAILEARVKRQR